MKFPGTCTVCGEKIEASETGLWAKGLGVKHERCAEPRELACIVCGGPAGCAGCELNEDCDLERVSQLCMCKGCSDAGDPFSAYLSSVKKKFHALNT